MLTLVNILIIFFIFLILYQIILATKVIEGLVNNVNETDQGNKVNILMNEYQPYDVNNPQNALILAQQNAGNISYLKQRIDSLQGNDLNKQVQDLSGNVQTLQTQVNGLVQAQQQYTTQMIGGTPPNITGTGASPDDTNTTTSTNTSNLVTS
jgi:predicted membrane protein